jgi:hypothetical protein
MIYVVAGPFPGWWARNFYFTTGSQALAYKRPVVYGLKSVFSGFKKLYGLTNP